MSESNRRMTFIVPDYIEADIRAVAEATGASIARVKEIVSNEAFGALRGNVKSIYRRHIESLLGEDD